MISPAFDEAAASHFAHGWRRDVGKNCEEDRFVELDAEVSEVAH